MTCGTRRLTGSPVIRGCRLPTCSGYSVTQSLSTTQLYVTPTAEDVIAGVLAHHQRQEGHPLPAAVPPAAGYRPESLDVLFGRERR